MLSQSSHIDSLTKQLNAHKALLNALGTCDIPWLHCLLRAANKNSWSPVEILRKIEQASSGGYETKSYTVSLG